MHYDILFCSTMAVTLHLHINHLTYTLQNSEVSEFQGVCMYKSMEMVFWTEQSGHIIIDGYITGVSGRRGSTVHLNQWWVHL